MIGARELPFSVVSLVSILIPCYNASRYIEAAVESALAQTWAEKEIIVVNDGSTDGSGEILESFRERGVKVLHEKNRGQCVAANRAFAESCGDYVKFFDADDLLSPDMVRLQMERLAGSSTAVASAEWGRFYGDDLSTFKLDPQNVWQDMDPLEWLVESWLGGGGMAQCALFLIPRLVLNRSGLWDERLSYSPINDFEFFTRVLSAASEVRFTAGARLFYRSGLVGSLSRLKNPQALEAAHNSLTWALDHLLERRQDARAQKACATVLQNFIYDNYPDEALFRASLLERIKELGGSDSVPGGTPGFHALRGLIGWKLARRIEKFAIRHGLNRAGLRQRLMRRHNPKGFLS